MKSHQDSYRAGIKDYEVKLSVKKEKFPAFAIK
jgi:hypothetical protein